MAAAKKKAAPAAVGAGDIMGDVTAPAATAERFVVNDDTPVKYNRRIYQPGEDITPEAGHVEAMLKSGAIQRV